MKHFWKIIAICLLATVLLLLIPACKGGGNDSGSTGSQENMTSVDPAGSGSAAETPEPDLETIVPGSAADTADTVTETSDPGTTSSDPGWFPGWY